jgi:hypothetical protein
MLGIVPALGRGFTGDDTRPGRDNVVLLSDGFWRRRFAAYRSSSDARSSSTARRAQSEPR